MKKIIKNSYIIDKINIKVRSRDKKSKINIKK